MHHRHFRPAISGTPGQAGKIRAGEPEDFPRADERRTPQPAQGPERRVRRLPQLRARRRPAVRRLEHLRAAGEALFEDVPGRGGSSFLRLDRRQRLDGFRRADQAPLRRAACGRLGIRGAGAGRPGEDRDAGPAGRPAGAGLSRPQEPVADDQAPGGDPGRRERLAGRGREELLHPQHRPGDRRAA